MTSKEILEDFLKGKPRWLYIGNEESYEGIYQGVQDLPNPFKPLTTQLFYRLDGKFFPSTARNLAEQFLNIPENTKVRISREGYRGKTSFKVVVL